MVSLGGRGGATYQAASQLPATMCLDPVPHPGLVGEILRARRWFDALSSGEVPTIATLARTEGVSASYISLKISLAFLAPDIVETIIDGMQPMSLTPERLKKACPLPASWEEQRAFLLA